jgi:hypothetical protein
VLVLLEPLGQMLLPAARTKVPGLLAEAAGALAPLQAVRKARMRAAEVAGLAMMLGQRWNAQDKQERARGEKFHEGAARLVT